MVRTIVLLVERNSRTSAVMAVQLVLSVATLARRQSWLSTPPQVPFLYEVRAALKSFPPMFHVTISASRVARRNVGSLRRAKSSWELVHLFWPRFVRVTATPVLVSV